MGRRIRLNMSDRLIEAEPKKALGQRLPEPLHRRLLELCDLVYESGQPQRPTKADLLGALILAAPEDPEVLIELLQRYGKADVRQAFVDSPEDSVLELVERTSGPRRGTR